jgi:hypothetical protein
MGEAAMNRESRSLEYRIQVDCRLGPAVTAHFPEWTVIPAPNGTTILHGSVPDQAALHGVLARIRDLGLTLISVSRQEA